MSNAAALLNALKDPVVLAQITAAGHEGLNALIADADPALRARVVAESIKRLKYEASGEHTYAELAASDIALDLRTVLNYTSSEARKTASHIGAILLSALGAALPGIWPAVIPLLKGILL